MPALRKFLIRFVGLFRRRTLEVEMNAELQAHLDGLTERNIAKGMSPEAARRAARLTFGGVEQVKEEAREARTWVWLEQFGQDLRYAVRALKKTPSFTLTAVLTLAFGIGVNAALFSVYNAVSLQSFPSRAPDELIALRGRSDGQRGNNDALFSYADFLDYRDGNHVFSGLTAYGSGFSDMQFGDEAGTQVDSMFDSRGPGFVIVQRVADNYFSVLGIEMTLGRGFLPEDSLNVAASPVIILSRAFWVRRLQSDPNIVGKEIRLNRRPHLVVGVAGEGFVGQMPAPPAGWMPLPDSPTVRQARQEGRLGMTGRLKPGVSWPQARTELDLMAQRLAEAFPREGRKNRIELSPAMRWFYIPITPQFIAESSPVLLGFGMVLMIACTNVANLLLARGVTRQPEIGVRLTLGASRGRVMRQLLTENLLLCMVGGALGLALAAWTLQLLRPLVLSYLPADWTPLVRMWQFLRLGPDARVFGCLAVLVLIAGAAAGIVPALHASRTNLISTLKDEGSAFGRRLSHSRLRSVLVISQMAVCTILLSCAGVLVRNMIRARSLNPGFDVNSVVGIELDLSTGPRERAALMAWVLQAIETFRTLPGVTEAAGAKGGIPTAGTEKVPLQFLPANGGEPMRMEIRIGFVTAGFFRTFGIPLQRGRSFTTAEAAGEARVAIVSEAAAARLWPNADPIGRTIALRESDLAARVLTPNSTAPDAYREYTVVGVARDIRQDLWDPDLSLCYFPLPTANNGFGGVFLRPQDNSEPGVAAIVRSAAGAGFTVRPNHRLSTWYQERMLPFTGIAALSGLLGGLALLMAAVGLYGVMSFSVNSRVREIGIRVALGATTERVVRLFLRQGMRLVVIGCVIGLAGGGLFALLLRKIQFGLGRTFDPIAFGAAAFVLAGVAMLACWLPARRATKVDPMVALRCE